MKRIQFVAYFMLLSLVMSGQSITQTMRDFLNAGEYEKLIDYSQKAREKLPPTSEEAIIEASYEIEALIRLSKFSEATKILDEELNLLTGSSIEAKAHIFNANGHLLLAKGRVTKALEQFEASLTLVKESEVDHSTLRADCYNNLGVAYWTDANNVLANEFLEKGLALRLEKFSESHVEVAGSYNNLGLIQSTINPKQALVFYEKALKIYKQQYGDVHPSVANAITNIALVRAQLGSRTQALRDFEKSRQIWREIHPNGHPNEAFVLSSMGQIQRDIKSYEQSEDFAKQSLDMYVKCFGKKHPEVAGAMNLIGVIKQDLGEYSLALQYFQNGICANIPEYDSDDIYQTTPLQRSFHSRVLLISLLDKAEAFEKRHLNKTLKRSDLREALKNLMSCDTLVEIIRHSLVNEKDKIALGELAAEVYEAGIRISFKLSQITTKSNYYRELAFYFCEKSKSTVLLEAISDSKAKQFANIPNEVLEEEEGLKSELAFLEQRLANEPEKEAEIRNLLFSTNRNYEKFIEGLEEQFPSYYNLKYNAQPVKVSELKEHLDSKTVLVNYFIALRSIYVFEVSKEKFEIHEIALDPNFDRNITGLRNSIRYDDKPTIYSTSRALYKQLFPMRLSNSIEKMIVIPDGRLAVLPFEVLISKDGNPLKLGYDEFKYLILDKEISYGYSATLYASSDNVKEKRSTKSIFLCAPVLFQNRNPDLPGTETECRAIDSLFRGVGSESSMYLKDDAQESIVKSSQLKTFNILHFATHGVVDENSPGQSKIEFTLNQASNDGDLFSAEIYNLDLNADLVTLSACQTGLGKISKGEGMIGLSRALLFAGAKNLIVSYWKVADQSTSQLMISFYDHLIQAGNGDYGWSLSQAKKELLKSSTTASPYYWAPFILIGD